MDEKSRASLVSFGNWILEVENGKVSTIKLEEDNEEACWIKVLNVLLIKT